MTPPQDLTDLAELILEQGDVELATEEERQAFEALVQAATVAPGLVDLGNPLERAAVLEARQRADTQQAQRIGLAANGLLGMATIQACQDNGKALGDVLAKTVARRVAEARRAR